MNNHQYEQERSHMAWEKHKAYYDTFINVEVVRMTEKAALVKINEVEYWLPRSIVQIATFKTESTGIEETFIDIPKWYTKENGITGAHKFDEWKKEQEK